MCFQLASTSPHKQTTFQTTLPQVPRTLLLVLFGLHCWAIGQEHFFAVLRDSREDEKFFAVVTSFIRASVARLADRQRRGVVQRKFKRAEREVHKLAAEGNRQSAGKRSRLRLWTRTTGGVGATVGAGDGRGRAKGMTRVLRGGDLFNTHGKRAHERRALVNRSCHRLQFSQ